MIRAFTVPASLAFLAVVGAAAAQEPFKPHPGTLIIHLGAADGALEIDLAKTGASLIHVLATDPNTVSALRTRFVKEKVAGTVIVEWARDWKTLPYPDRFVQHLIADLDALRTGPSMAEIERVLAAQGSARVRKGGEWRTIKRADAGPIDGWTHKWYDPTGNPVSKAKIAGPPTVVQWAHGPAFADRAVGGKMPRIAGGFSCALIALMAPCSRVTPARVCRSGVPT